MKGRKVMREESKTLPLVVWEREFEYPERMGRAAWVALGLGGVILVVTLLIVALAFLGGGG